MVFSDVIAGLVYKVFRLSKAILLSVMTESFCVSTLQRGGTEQVTIYRTISEICKS